MENSSTSARLALIKLLKKLGLLTSKYNAKEVLSAKDHPILYFAKKGEFDETVAIESVAKELKLDVWVLNKDTCREALEIFTDPLVEKFSLDLWREASGVPVRKIGRKTFIALANPLDHSVKQSFEFETGLDAQIVVGSEYEIQVLIGEKVAAGEAFSLSSIVKEGNKEPFVDSEAAKHSNLNETNLMHADASAPPVVRLVDKVFTDSLKLGASDIHISPEKDVLSVKIRVDGMMQSLLEVPSQFRQAVTSRIKLLSGMDISEKRKPQDGRLRLKTSGGEKDLRLSSMPTLHGESIVIRILNSDAARLSFEQLGMPQEIENNFRQSLKASSRVVLVSGPTGSGKTSTLYTGVMSLLDGKTNIVTVEDPIEYRIPGIKQSQINSKIGMTFAEGLRSILRQDPDVIMVGEIRDPETASIAMQSAQTGHLVLSTIHTNSAAAAVVRLLDLGVPAYVIASSLGAVLAQRLIRKLCSSCRKPADASELRQLLIPNLDPEKVYEAGQCEACDMTGFKGRQAVYSLLTIDDEIRALVRDGVSEKELENAARHAGFRSLAETGVELLNQGVTTIAELERVLGPLRTQLGVSRVFERKLESPSGGLSKRKILLVEDDENTRAVLALMLKSELYAVDEAIDGYSALERVHENLPELIVCDLMMPKMGGLELVERLRRDPRTRNIPIIILTAADTEENEFRTIHGGADDFVSKTAETKIMLARVQRLLDRTGARA